MTQTFGEEMEMIFDKLVLEFSNLVVGKSVEPPDGSQGTLTCTAVFAQEEFNKPDSWFAVVKREGTPGTEMVGLEYFMPFKDIKRTLAKYVQGTYTNL